MNPIIEVENLTKIYRLGNLHGSYLTFRDSITQLFKTNPKNRKKHFIKALDNVNLTIDKGQKIGVIGKNGAGKSTFLKILSRITYPTSGSVILRGRVASLL
ncbi:MAG: ATP-binding cassette domain-containing protein, partial [Bacteroidales bacterium]|nr:ATP-binding cassette domain-containing protein [Bacteroidales bacterium]